MHQYKKLQANAIFNRIHQVVGSMLKTKDLDIFTFDAVDPWSESIVYIAYDMARERQG